MVSLYGYLLLVVVLWFIVFVSIISKDGEVNLSFFSFFNVFGVNFLIVIFFLVWWVWDNIIKYMLENVQEVVEVVINIVNYFIVEQMLLSSMEYVKGVNEFIKLGFIVVDFDLVKLFCVGEVFVVLECKVKQIIEMGQEGGVGNFIMVEVVVMYICNEYLDDVGYLDIQKLDLVVCMGGSWYCWVQGDVFFEIFKLVCNQGIGVDQLLEIICNSIVFNGNNLGCLGNVEELLIVVQVVIYLEMDECLKDFLVNEGVEVQYVYVKDVLEQGEIEKVLFILLVGQ